MGLEVLFLFFFVVVYFIIIIIIVIVIIEVKLKGFECCKKTSALRPEGVWDIGSVDRRLL